MLGMDPPQVLAYPRETVVAEKLHAMVILDISNTRMKDFYDLWFLSRSWPFQMITLSDAICATFARRALRCLSRLHWLSRQDSIPTPRNHFNGWPS